VKTIHASQLSAEAKHEACPRQLTPLAAAFLAIGLMLTPVSAAPPEATVREELQAAELMTAALFARDAGTEELRKMERIYADLAKKYPGDATVKNAQGEFLWSTGEHTRAVEVWLAAERIDPKSAVVLDHLGGAFLAAGDAKKAAAYYARATQSAPDNAAYHYNYANVAFLFRHELLNAAHPDAASVLLHALSHFADASRLAPLNPEYARAYAETFYIVPNPDWRTALQAWQHFYNVTPGKDFALLNLARVHMKLGDKPEARKNLDQIQSAEFDRLKKRLLERIEVE
jgi:tetratricopeptide (TPR) repeat protein